MSNQFTDKYEKSLKGLKRRGRYRQMTIAESQSNLADFSSNDYLGLAANEDLKENILATLADHKIGSTGSRLLAGTHQIHRDVERFASDYFGSNDALFFANGFMANYALLTCLPKKSDVVLYDSLVHASFHDGMQAGKAQIIEAKHNDLADFETKLKSLRDAEFTGQIWIAIESLYSMDGDFAPIDEFMALCKKYDAILIVDEAHSTGVFGKDGRGLCEKWEGDPQLISIHTCGKAMGVSGAFICGDPIYIDYMVNFSRPFIFSTSPSPMAVFSVMKSLEFIKNNNHLSDGLKELIQVKDGFVKQLGFEPSGSQIQPIVIGEAKKTMEIASKLQQTGFDVKGVRPPTVEEGASRLRITITNNVTKAQIENLFESLGAILS